MSTSLTTRTYRSGSTELTLAACSRGTLTSQDIAAMTDLPMSGNHMGREVGMLLIEIVREEHHQGRALLSVLVTTTNGMVRQGFFDLVHDLGLLLSVNPPDSRGSLP